MTACALQGIGEAAAFRFAQAGSSVYILGRSFDRGTSIINQLSKIAKPGQTFEFVQADLRCVLYRTSGAREASHWIRRADAWRVWLGPARSRESVTLPRCSSRSLACTGSTSSSKLKVSNPLPPLHSGLIPDHNQTPNHPGGPPNGRFTTNPDGNDTHFAIQILSRFGLAFLLAKSGTLKDSVTVVCAPGGAASPAPDASDLQLTAARAAGRLSWGRAIPATGARDTAVTDAWTAHLAEKFPHLRVSHLFPGYVSTKAAANAGFPWPVVALQRAADPVLTRTIGNTAAGYAEVPVFAAANPEARRLPGSEWLGPKLQSYGRPKWVDDQRETRIAVWDALKALLGED